MGFLLPELVSWLVLSSPPVPRSTSRQQVPFLRLHRSRGSPSPSQGAGSASVASSGLHTSLSRFLAGLRERTFARQGENWVRCARSQDVGRLGRTLWQPGRPRLSPRMPAIGTVPASVLAPTHSPNGRLTSYTEAPEDPFTQLPRLGRAGWVPDVSAEHGTRAHATVRSSLGAIQPGTRLRRRRCFTLRVRNRPGAPSAPRVTEPQATFLWRKRTHSCPGSCTGK